MRTTSTRTAPVSSPEDWRIIAGDCLTELTALPDVSVDAVVTDPPYGIDFQGESWRSTAIRQAANARHNRPLSPGESCQAWSTVWAAECLRLLKPGGHLLAFGAPRTVHRLAAGIEDAGLELRDTLMWLYGTGMPKSRRLPGGRGTQLKPAYEPIVLARRPPDGSIAETGALNVDACRVNDRYPAHLALSHAPGCSDTACHPSCPVQLVDDSAARGRGQRHMSRLFYCPKASRRERDAGCEDLPTRTLDIFPNAQRNGSKPPAKAANIHPTVKPIELMRWLVRLTAPPNGTVLDPFCGSGSTGAAAVLEQRRFIGIELDANYRRIAKARIAHWSAQARSQQQPTRSNGGGGATNGRARPR